MEDYQGGNAPFSTLVDIHVSNHFVPQCDQHNELEITKNNLKNTEENDERL